MGGKQHARGGGSRPRDIPAAAEVPGVGESEVTSAARIGSARSADEILELIFTPTPRASPAEQAERTLRRPKPLVYVAMSNRNFFWRQQLTKYVLDEGRVPVTPFMLFDYYLLHTVPKDLVREAMNNLIARCEEMWVFGDLSLGLKVQVGIAKRLHKSVRYFDITDLPYQINSVPESMVSEEK